MKIECCLIDDSTVDIGWIDWKLELNMTPISSHIAGLILDRTPETETFGRINQRFLLLSHLFDE